jgi:hypothetical protein
MNHQKGGETIMSTKSTNKGLQVTMAGLGINLALGVLYAWSIFKGAIKSSIEKGGPDAFNWSLSSINDPYALCCLVFAFAMIVAGKCQDRLGPARTALIGRLYPVIVLQQLCSLGNRLRCAGRRWIRLWLRRCYTPCA